MLLVERWGRCEIGELDWFVEEGVRKAGRKEGWEGRREGRKGGEGGRRGTYN